MSTIRRRSPRRSSRRKSPARRSVRRSSPWIRREGKLGGEGYLKKSATQRHKLLRECVERYGYRSVKLLNSKNSTVLRNGDCLFL